MFADTAFATVAADILASAGETVDGEAALVGTAFTFGHGGGVFQSIDAVNGEHRSLGSLLISFSCDEGSSECTHDTGDIRADSLTASDFFKTSQDTVIVEGTALNYNMVAELRGI